TKEDREVEEDEKVRTAKLNAQSIQDHYRHALRTDPHIAYVQILGMKDSVRVEDVYVSMRVLKEARGHHELGLLGLIGTDDPHSSEEVYRRELERLRSRVSAAMDPYEAI